jgi:DnaK suppressor protein
MGHDVGLTMDDIVAVLESKRAKLEAQLARLSAPPPETGGISFGKRVGEGTDAAVERLAQVATYDKLHAVLADVRRALTKIDQGTYGTCDGCGSRIAEERLESLPWANLCVKCAAARR